MTTDGAAGFGTLRRDLLPLALAGGAAATSAILGWNPAMTIVLAAAAPGIALIATGQVPRRLGVAGCLGIGVAAALVPPAVGGVAVGDLGLLGMIAMGAVMAARAADRLAPGVTPEPMARSATETSGWMTVVVEGDAPSNAMGAYRKPPVRPIRDPERRSVARLASRRHRAPQRELVTADSD